MLYLKIFKFLPRKEKKKKTTSSSLLTTISSVVFWLNVFILRSYRPKTLGCYYMHKPLVRQGAKLHGVIFLQGLNNRRCSRKVLSHNLQQVT